MDWLSVLFTRSVFCNFACTHTIVHVNIHVSRVNVHVWVIFLDPSLKKSFLYDHNITIVFEPFPNVD